MVIFDGKNPGSRESRKKMVQLIWLRSSIEPQGGRSGGGLHPVVFAAGDLGPWKAGETVGDLEW